MILNSSWAYGTVSMPSPVQSPWHVGIAANTTNIGITLGTIYDSLSKINLITQS